MIAFASADPVEIHVEEGIEIFEIYAFPDTVGYHYAEENHIPVHPLYATIID